MRHAQKHWIEIQATKAAKSALNCQFQGTEAEVENEIDMINEIFSSAEVDALEIIEPKVKK